MASYCCLCRCWRASPRCCRTLRHSRTGKATSRLMLSMMQHLMMRCSCRRKTAMQRLMTPTTGRSGTSLPGLRASVTWSAKILCATLQAFVDQHASSHEPVQN